MITYTLYRTNRKTIAIYVRNGKVEVRAPQKASKRVIDQFIVSKEKWIAGKLATSCERQERREAFTLNYGDMVLYRGEAYPIAAIPEDRGGFDGERFFIPDELVPKQIKCACILIYRMLAKRDLSKKVSEFAKQMGVRPIAVKINGAKTRWGSCSGQKSLNFSWRLIMAEDEVIDYVVVHELAHISEMNHSGRFWAIVAGVLPDYQERQKRLKDLQKKLIMEEWE